MTNRLHYGYTRLQSAERTEDFENSSSVSQNGSRFQGHNSDSSDNQDSDHSATQLRRIQKSGKRSERWPGSASHSPCNNPTEGHWDFIEHIIKPGETLQGLALQYRVSIFELKRANSIGKDAEFHARRIIKIPVHQHSSLKDKVPNIDQTVLPLPVTDHNVDSEGDDQSSKFLDQVDQDLQRIKERAKVYDIDHENFTADLEELRLSSRSKRSDCSGDNWGLSWTQLVCIALILLLACPLLYFLHLELVQHRWLADKRSLHHNPQSYNLNHSQVSLIS